MDSEEQLLKQIHPVKYYQDYLQHNIRPDGRELLSTRPLIINVGSISAAESSAIVKLGNTIAVCGIKAELAMPSALEPEKGYFVPNVEFTPLCSQKYRPGAPSEDAQVCSHALNAIIRNSGFLDLKDLCIVKEKLAWTLYCDVVCLNHDGCILDAALISIAVALKSLKLPKVVYNTDTEACDVEEGNSSTLLPLHAIPVSMSFMVFEDKIITDPTADEEKLAASFITVAVCNSELTYVYKPGGAPIEPNQLEMCVKQTLHREKHVLEIINQVLKT